MIVTTTGNLILKSAVGDCQLEIIRRDNHVILKISNSVITVKARDFNTAMQEFFDPQLGVPHADSKVPVSVQPQNI